MISRTLVGRVASGSMIALLLGSLMGCSADREPSVLETPDIVWPDGMPNGPYDNTEWVEALRARDVAREVALMTLDFSDRTYVKIWGYREAQKMAEQFEDTRSIKNAVKDYGFVLTPYFAGPPGLTVLDQFETSDSEVVLVVCNDRSDLAEGLRDVETVTITRDSDGRYRFGPAPDEVTKRSSSYQEECDAAEIRLGYFDPPFTPILVGDAHVIGPADASKYDLP